MPLLLERASSSYEVTLRHIRNCAYLDRVTRKPASSEVLVDPSTGFLTGLLCQQVAALIRYA